MRQFAQFGDDFVQPRQHHAIACRFQHQGMGQIVDVLGGAGEVDEFADFHYFCIARQLVFEPVFHRFDVMVGGFFDVLHGLRIGF